MTHPNAKPSPQSLLSTPLSGVLVRVGGVVFAAESLIMLALMGAAPSNHNWFILDAPILTVVVAIVVNYWIVKPESSKLTLAMKRLNDAKHEAEILATIDPLTGVLNRRAFFRRFEIELQSAQGTNLPLSFLMLDVDFFKNVNDKYGHLAADVVLKAISDAMQSSVDGRGFVGRFGGEEFCMLLVNTSLDDAVSFAEGIRTGVARTVVEDLGRPICVTVSIGVTQGEAQMLDNLDAIIRQADLALLSAKSTGRNCVRASPRRSATLEPAFSCDLANAHFAV